MKSAPRNNVYNSDSDSDGQEKVSVSQERQQHQQGPSPQSSNLPTSSTHAQPAGSLLKGATDKKGNLKDAALMVDIKLDLEAEIHLTGE